MNAPTNHQADTITIKPARALTSAEFKQLFAAGFVWTLAAGEFCAPLSADALRARDELACAPGIIADQDQAETDQTSGEVETDQTSGEDETDQTSGEDEADQPSGEDETDQPSGEDETDQTSGEEKTEAARMEIEAMGPGSVKFINGLWWVACKTSSAAFCSEALAQEAAAHVLEVVNTSGEEKAAQPSGERVQTVERQDKAGKTWQLLARIHPGESEASPLYYGALGVAQVRAQKLRAAGIAATVMGRGPYRIAIDPTASPEAAPACATLIAGRWIPGGAENAERVAFDEALGAEVWMMTNAANEKADVIAYSGKRTKRDAYIATRDRERALQWADEYMAKKQASANYKAEQLAEKKARRDAGHKLQVGDVLRSSWGYDQTNIDYFEVTKIIGARMVEIREIGQQSEETGYMSGQCVPAPGHYTSEPMRKAVSDGGDSVKVRSFAWAYKIEPQIVAGVKCFESSGWSSYA